MAANHQPSDALQRADKPRPGDEIAPVKYRKRPVEIEAIRWSGRNLRQIIDFTGLHPSAEKWTWDEYEAVVRTEGFKIFTLEGPHMVSVGDYVIRGVKGEFYACKPDIFWLTYQRATSLPPEIATTWIPVGERLPETSDFVLTFSPTAGMWPYRWVECHGRGRGGAKTWIDEHGDDSSSYGEDDYDITHWMPLPEAPK